MPPPLNFSTHSDEAAEPAAGTPIAGSHPAASSGGASLDDSNLVNVNEGDAREPGALASTPETGRGPARCSRRIAKFEPMFSAAASSAGASNGSEKLQLQAVAAASTAPATALTPAALMERFVSMFLKAEEGPVASGSGKAALAPTVGFVLAVSDNHPQSRIITSALWFPKSGYCHPLACIDVRAT